MYIEEIKRGLRVEIKKRENEQYCTCETNIRQMCKDVLAKIEEQESVIADKDKVIAHHKYKRCLAMARIAQDDWHLHNSFYAMGHQEFEKRKCEFYEKWRNRWLAIA